eukprot:2108614-Prymnesium_polylepis.1
MATDWCDLNDDSVLLLDDVQPSQEESADLAAQPDAAETSAITLLPPPPLVPLPLADHPSGGDIVGKRISVFWGGDGAWYSGLAIRYELATDLITVVYDDDECVQHSFADAQWTLQEQTSIPDSCAAVPAAGTTSNGGAWHERVPQADESVPPAALLPKEAEEAVHLPAPGKSSFNAKSFLAHYPGEVPDDP